MKWIFLNSKNSWQKNLPSSLSCWKHLAQRMEKLYQALCEIFSGWQVCGCVVWILCFFDRYADDIDSNGLYSFWFWHFASNWHADLKDWNGFFKFEKFDNSWQKNLPSSLSCWKHLAQTIEKLWQVLREILSGWQVWGYVLLKKFFWKPKVVL